MKTAYNHQWYSALVSGSSKGIGLSNGQYLEHSGASVLFHGASESYCHVGVHPKSI